MTNPRPALLLLSPGPVSLSMSTKREMLQDYAIDGKRIQQDISFCRDYLLRIANGVGMGTVVPIPGSSTYANEAVIQTFVPRTGKLLVHSNGVFGDRLADICRATRQPYELVRTPLTRPLSVDELRQALISDPAITHMVVVHCETSTGVTNPIEEIAMLCQETGKGLLIDAVSSFGVLELDMRRLRFEALILGSNKCMQGPPGLAWVVADEKMLKRCEGNACTLSLDLWDQWRHLEQSGCFRFTPPTHVVAAFAQALLEHEREGGQEGRLQRYRRNHRRLVIGMREMGFETLLPDEIAAPIVATFLHLDDPRYDPAQFCRRMERRGFHISLRRSAVPNTMRIGCMGNLDESDMADVVAAVDGVLDEMGMSGFACGLECQPVDIRNGEPFL